MIVLLEPLIIQQDNSAMAINIKTSLLENERLAHGNIRGWNSKPTVERIQITYTLRSCSMHTPWRQLYYEQEHQ